MHQFVWQLTITLVLLVIAVFALIALKSGGKKEYDPIVKKGYKIRTAWFYLLLIVIVTSFFFTLADLPYDKDKKANANEESVQVVDAVAKQFVFELSQTQVKAGQPVLFRVTSGDVNHGFGIYDGNDKLLGQTQAMPNYTNNLMYTFDKPGTYQILCLEYCGIAHHAMIAKIEVVE